MAVSWYFLQSDGSILEFAVDDTSAVIPARKYPALQGTDCEFESLALDVAGPGRRVQARARKASKQGMHMWLGSERAPIPSSSFRFFS